MFHIFMKLVKYIVKTNGLFMKQTLGFCLREAMKHMKLGHKKTNVAVL